MLKIGENWSSIFWGEVMKQVCKMFAAWVAMIAASWRRVLLYSVVFVGRCVLVIFPSSKSSLPPIKSKLNIIVFSFASCSFALLAWDSTIIFWGGWERKEGGVWLYHHGGGNRCWLCWGCWLCWFAGAGGTNCDGYLPLHSCLVAHSYLRHLNFLGGGFQQLGGGRQIGLGLLSKYFAKSCCAAFHFSEFKSWSRKM